MCLVGTAASQSAVAHQYMSAKQQQQQKKKS